MQKKIKIAAMCGSLRKGSYNAALLRAAVKLAPATVEVEVLDIGKLPLFNQDFEGKEKEANELKRKIKEADAVLFVSPEYNYSISGVLKNAIDWISRPYGDNSFEGKPAAIVGVSTGMIATARMQYHLRQVMVFLDMKPINRPEMMIGLAPEKFDSGLNLTDAKTQEKIGEMFDALVKWTLILNQGKM